jgi:hypothetical protein
MQITIFSTSLKKHFLDVLGNFNAAVKTACKIPKDTGRLNLVNILHNVIQAKQKTQAESATNLKKFFTI